MKWGRRMMNEFGTINSDEKLPARVFTDIQEQKLTEHSEKMFLFESISDENFASINIKNFNLKTNFGSKNITFKESVFKNISESFKGYSFKGCTFSGCQFNKVNFVNCVLKDTTFLSCNFVNCVFQRNLFFKAQFYNCTFTNCIIVSNENKNYNMEKYNKYHTYNDFSKFISCYFHKSTIKDNDFGFTIRFEGCMFNRNDFGPWFIAYNMERCDFKYNNI